MIADHLELYGLGAVVDEGRGACCVVTSCALCHAPFNPLRGPCGTVVCPVCLLELASSDRAGCSPCNETDPEMCPVHRARHAA